MSNRTIPTRYGGTRFRSTLEAKWARFFDLLGWQWTYEPFETGMWIPDFLVRGDAPFLVEVGPCVDLSDFSTKAGEGPLQYVEQRPDLPTLVLGAAPNALYLGGQAWAGYMTTDGGGLAAMPFVWAVCHTCRKVGAQSYYGGYRVRPCGHGGDSWTEITETEIVALWRVVANDLQWKRPA